MTSEPSSNHDRLLAQLVASDPYERIDAAFTLAEQGTLAGRDTLLQALSNSDWRIRLRATNRLGRIGPSWAAEHLDRLLDDPLTDIRAEAIFALLNIGRPAVVSPLLRALRDPDPERREDACVALRLLLGDEAVEGCADIIEDEDAQRVESWWAHHSAHFNPDIVYANGQPASLAVAIEAFANASPQAVNILSGKLSEWTSKHFPGDHREQADAWRRWWQANLDSFPAGHRYFHGRDVEKLS